jgi:hypothetical protein
MIADSGIVKTNKRKVVVMMAKARNNPVDTSGKNWIMGPDGKPVSLDSLPLVAYGLNCGHLGRDYAVQKGDVLFCEECGTTKRVSRIIAN